jgi:hypothetical protein
VVTHRIKQPRVLAERLEAANAFLAEYPVFGKHQLWLDDMDNAAGLAYCALPERLFIVRDGVIVYVGGYGPFDYKISEVREWLVARA